MSKTSPARLLAAIPGHLRRPPQHGELVAYGWSPQVPDCAVVLTLAGDTAPWEQTQLCHQLVTDGAEAVVFAAYGTHPARPGLPIDADAPELSLHWLVASALRYGLDVPDALIVSGDRWWSLGCTDPSCCPPEGNPIIEGPTP